MSSHKNEATIRNYAVHCPDSKKWEISESLAQAMVPEKKKKTEEPNIPDDPLLQEVDWDDDEMLVKVLENIEKENQNLPPLQHQLPIHKR